MKEKANIRDYSMAVGLVLIWLFFSFSTDTFLSPRNLSLLAIQLSVTATLALGMLLVLLPGRIDLSVGSGVGLIGGVACVLIVHHQWSAPAAMLLSLALALGLWAGMGSLIVKHRIPAFIITLGGLLVYKGIFWKVIDSQTVPVQHGDEANALSLLTTYFLPRDLGYGLVVLAAIVLLLTKLSARKRKRQFGFELPPLGADLLRVLVATQALLLLVLVLNQYQGVPLSVAILGLLGLFIHLLCTQTRFGRYLYAIGGNEEAARLSGVPVERTLIFAYCLLGLIVGLTGFMQAAYQGSSTTTVGNLMELDAIAACVIGGTSLAGGRGNVLGVLVGALIMATLLNGMGLMSVAPETEFIARGLVLILAVWLDVRISKRS